MCIINLQKRTQALHLILGNKFSFDEVNKKMT